MIPFLIWAFCKVLGHAQNTTKALLNKDGLFSPLPLVLLHVPCVFPMSPCPSHVPVSFPCPPCPSHVSMTPSFLSS